MDPFYYLFSGSSPYNFCSNSPLSKIDVNGEWDIEIHLFHDRGKFGYGILILRNKKGKEILRFVVRAQGMKHKSNNGNPRDRMKQYGDSPTGTYKFEKWRSDGDKDTYGPNPRLDMVGIAGEILLSKRTEVQIHGGRQKGAKYKGSKLWNTGGCFRIADDEIKVIKLKCDELELDIEETKNRLIRVSNDLTYDSETESYFIPSELTSLNDKRGEIKLLKENIEKQTLNIQNTKRSDYSSDAEYRQALENKQNNLNSMNTELENKKKEQASLEKNGIKGEFYGKSS